MKKRISLLLALVLLISLFPVYAESFDSLAQRAGDTLQSYGAIKGGSDGNLMIDQTLKRQDAVVILTRLMGKEREAEAMSVSVRPFTDITISYYDSFLALAKKNKWVEGKGGGIFGFNENVTYKEFSAMLLRALGYDTTGKNYSKVTQIANSINLYNGLQPYENDEIIRGAAFILMNNTLETAPKGETKPLVYKLGYRTEPAPEKFSVTGVESVGLKAIDVKFSEPVNESTLNFIHLSKDKGKQKVGYDTVMLDDLTVRLVLQNTASQDTTIDVSVHDVKSVKQELVAIHHASVTMSDTTPPEVLSVEALNPKTLIVKVSEPIKLEAKSFTSLSEFKIEGKALNGKVHNNLENQLTVELSNALKPGDYTVEVSGLRDYAGFSNKSQDFNITVVEDKDAPVIESASLISKTKIKVNFNEMLTNKGQFKVDGKNVSSGNIELSKNKMSALLTVSPLSKAALVEIKVEYKGQRDVMGNEVTNFTAFTFKAEDDTELPDVTKVEVISEFVHVHFNKQMDTSKGKYTVQEGGKFVIRTTNAAGKFAPGDSSKLIIDASSILRNGKATTYSLILEGFVDASIRGNEMQKLVKTFDSSDKVAPSVKAEYSVENAGRPDKILKIKLYFSKEMNKDSLLDMKNYTFSNFEYQGVAPSPNKRADEVSAYVQLNTEDNDKTLVIEATDPKVLAVGNITLIGLKDKANNSLPTTTVRPFSSAPQSASAEFIRDSDAFVIKLVFTQPVEVLGDDVFKLTAGSENLNLRYRDRSADMMTYYFDFDQNGVKSNAMKGSNALTMSLISPSSGDNAKSIYGSPAVAPSAIIDKAPPMVALDSNGDPEVEYNSSGDSLAISFDETMSYTKSDYAFNLKDANGNFVPIQISGTSGSQLILKRITPYTTNIRFPNGISTLTLLKTKDVNGNDGKDYAPIDLPNLNLSKADVTSDPLYMEEGSNVDEVTLSFTMPITADSLDPSNFSFAYDHSDYTIYSVKISSDGLQLIFSVSYLDTYSSDQIAIEVKNSAGIRDAANGGSPITGTYTGYPQ